MSTTPPQLFLLADHIKLSLLERQRAISLNLSPNTQDGHIARSLDQLRAGIESLESQVHDTADECALLSPTRTHTANYPPPDPSHPSCPVYTPNSPT